jgi:Kef-type K+ transport system membrane component KefB
LMGEAMQRIGQPAVMGQLIAGVLLGPSVFGAIWPEAQRALFASSPQQQSMIDAVSQLGILMLLLLTGMETDLSLVKQARRAAISASDGRLTDPLHCLAHQPADQEQQNNLREEKPLRCSLHSHPPGRFQCMNHTSKFK